MTNGCAASGPAFRASAKSRFHGADFRVCDGLAARAGRLRLVGIPGMVKFRWHRELPARLTHAVISRSNGKWHVTRRFKVAGMAVPGEGRSRPDAGIGAGVDSLAATSDGDTVPAPRWCRAAGRKTRRLQRALSRKRRSKARRTLARHHPRSRRELRPDRDGGPGHGGAEAALPRPVDSRRRMDAVP